MVRTEEGIRTRTIGYAPLPSQEKFHNSKARFKGFSGPIGSGKSQALCQEAIRLAYLNPGRPGLIGAPTYPMLRDATLSTLFEILNANRIPYDFNKAENLLTLNEVRSKILVRSLDEFERLRGTNLAWFAVDELTYTAEEAWLRLEGRLRDPKAKKLCGCAVWTPKGFDWVYKRFIQEPVEGYEAILAPAYENRFLLDQIPDYYERLKSSYDERFFQQEVLGAYLNVSAGQVYHAFDRKINVTKAEADPVLPLMWALDFNVDPMSSVIAQRSADEVKVLDEIVLHRASTEQACEEFHNRYPMWEAGVKIYGDASGERMQTCGNSDYDVLRRFFREAGYRRWGLAKGASNPPVKDRVQMMNSLLRSADGETALYVDAKCKELIKDFEQVTYKPDSSVVDKERDSQRTHLSDALGYLVWQEFRVRAPFGPQSRGLM
ncbi:MAG TPA: terminase family protein [Bryobacteraceae bacterium]|nr:terminase family protein [Bryobacteraceae bacterium]